MAYEHILYEVSDKVATITLNRPDRMNAWTPTMERDVRHAMEASSTDSNLPISLGIPRFIVWYREYYGV